MKIFDIETDGRLHELTKVHCIEVIDSKSNVAYHYGDQPGLQPLQAGLDFLSTGDILAHHANGFDIPALQKVYPSWEPKGKVHDSLPISRMAFPRLQFTDRNIPSELVGRHSIEAWGHRVGKLKGNYGKQTNWKNWSPEMQAYCQLDTEILALLWEQILALNIPQLAMDLETDFSICIEQMMNNGMSFNTIEGIKLAQQLKSEKQILADKIQVIIPPKIEKTPFTPKANRPAQGYVKGVPTFKEKTVIFNPGSRKKIEKHLREQYGWNPVDFTDKGNPSLTSEVLEGLYSLAPEVELFDNYLTAQKLVGQLADGPKAWLKNIRDGKIYGYCNHNGARTSRCTHSNPNLAQIPRVGSFMGLECRNLFTAPDGLVLVGADASGLELRNLAHYLYPYDGGLYAKAILEGDIHTANMQALSIDSRDIAKRWIYAHNYGAGDEKLGSILEPTSTKGIQKSLGRDMRASFVSKTKGIAPLLRDIKAAHKSRKWLKGLDGRKLPSVSEHSALNTLLQGAGAIIMKQATVLAVRGVKNVAKLVLHVHDEYQWACKEKFAHYTGEITVEAIAQAGRDFNYRIPLTGEYKIGTTWADTH